MRISGVHMGTRHSKQLVLTEKLLMASPVRLAGFKATEARDGGRGSECL